MRPAGINKSHDLYFTVHWLRRISRPINGSKLFLRMRIYLCETSRNMQQP